MLPSVELWPGELPDVMGGLGLPVDIEGLGLAVVMGGLGLPVPVE